uniref:enhancer of mRNA-decapping protein 4-like isoform X2 n=1 Tax=Fragaria vesca subsp. vesca TaxID=101020 RepID=UPI0005C8EBEE|nr:PREDICTED: enhancer of mRNA-decapping protein 4-like isoform X2 [Fragaria vesca subsp. vesca]
MEMQNPECWSPPLLHTALVIPLSKSVSLYWVSPKTLTLISTPPPSLSRMSSDKLPQGRHLSGVSVVYDVDVRRPGEFQPQLGVRSTITNYDPQPVLGRQIAVNKSYICYGLKLGIIRVMNKNNQSGLKLRTLTQRVTDMAFFAEDVHLLASVSVEGRLFVWKISEGLDEGGTPQITGKIVIAIQIVDEGEAVHPRVCWHCSKQEILFVGVGKRVLRIDTTKVAKCGVPSAEDPIKCPVEKLIDGVQFVGEHDGEVTDLSMCQGMTTTRLVSASMDGTIKIWDDRKTQPLIVLRPYGGLPVYSSIFMTAPNKPDHIILVTVGPLNREVKIWSSATEVLTSDDESWKCTQTLELKSSAQPRVEDAFFNQVIALSQAGLLLLANAKKEAIYAVHIDFGGEPAATHMDYIVEFTVAMPVLSFTGTSISPHGEQIVQVYCVQTRAIQQYDLDISKCLPPPLVMSTNSASRPGKLPGIRSLTDGTHSGDQQVNEYSIDNNTGGDANFHEVVDNSDEGNPELKVNTAVLQIKAMRDEMDQLEIKQKDLQKELQEHMTMRKKAIKDNADALQLALSNCFQKLEKSVLEATVHRQIQLDFENPGNQSLRDALKSSIEASMVPAIEKSCDAMYQKVIAKLQTAEQQHFESVHSPLANSIRDIIKSVSSTTQFLSTELAGGHRYLLDLVVGGGNLSAVNPLGSQVTGGFHEKVEVSLDPREELRRLVLESKYEVAFRSALQRNDIGIVYWLCHEVNLHGILQHSLLSQEILFPLFQQLAYGFNIDPIVDAWMRDVAIAMNQTFAIHGKERVLQVLHELCHLPAVSNVDRGRITDLMDFIDNI